MKENENNELTKYILENYDIKDINDIVLALKDVFKDTIKTRTNTDINPQIVPKKTKISV